MDKTGLVLEGGGMRGVFTAGALDFFMENNIYLPYVVGVSAGACNGTSYVSKQFNRSKRVTIDYVDHPDYLSFRNLFLKREFFGMDLLFRDIPTKYDPFDFNAYFNSNQKMLVGATDCQTGEAVYFSNKDTNNKEDLLTHLRASCSIPYFAPIINHDSRYLLDGGIADPIPIHRAEKDGYSRNIVILTQHREYRKKPPGISKVLRHRYRQYPKLIHTLLYRHENYNELTKYVYKQEKEKNTFVIQPMEPLKSTRFEKNKSALTATYEQGYNVAKGKFGELEKWLNI